MSLAIPDWMPLWAQVLLLGLGIIVIVAFLLMPFAVYGVKGRLSEIALQLEDAKADLRVLTMRVGALVPEQTAARRKPEASATQEEWIPPGVATPPAPEFSQRPLHAAARPASLPRHSCLRMLCVPLRKQPLSRLRTTLPTTLPHPWKNLFPCGGSGQPRPLAHSPPFALPTPTNPVHHVRRNSVRPVWNGKLPLSRQSTDQQDGCPGTMRVVPRNPSSHGSHRLRPGQATHPQLTAERSRCYAGRHVRQNSPHTATDDG